MRKLVVVLFLVCLAVFASSQTVKIDIENTQNVNLSELTAQVRAVKLGLTGFALGTIGDVCIVGDKMLVLEYRSKFDRLSGRVLLFDTLGKYIGPFEQEKGLNGWGVARISSDCQRKRFYIYSADGVSEFNSDGTMLKHINQKAVIQLTSSNQVWLQKELCNPDGPEVQLMLAQDDNEPTLVHRFKFEMPQSLLLANVYMYPNIWVGRAMNQIYVASPTHNTVFCYTNGKLEPAFKIRYSDCKQLKFNDMLQTYFFSFGSLLAIQHRRGVKAYSCLYWPNTGRTINIAYLYDKGDNLVQGIRDDLLGTGLLVLQGNGGIAFFVKQNNELLGSRFYSTDNPNPTVFIFTPKP